MSNPRKPNGVAVQSTSTPGRRQSANSQAHRAPSPKARGASPARVLTSHGTARTPAPMRSPSGVARPNRASVRRPSSIVGSIGNINSFAEEDAPHSGSVGGSVGGTGGSAAPLDDDSPRIESAALVDNLKKSLRAAEVMCEEHRQRAETMQQKMDQMLREHAQLEERFHAGTLQVAALEARKKEDSRQIRDMASLFESERTAMLRDREEATLRERELQLAVQRLKETMAGREMRFNVAARPERRMSRQGTSVLSELGYSQAFYVQSGLRAKTRSTYKSIG